jgi:hypothetical protein
MICEGQQQASALGYSPLPMNLVQAASDVIKTIPGTVGGVDFNSCNNPTFKPGDSPSNNQLAATARCRDCDKQGTTQCATGTGATVDTPVTGTGGSGQATSGSGAADAAAPAAAAGAAAGGADPVYDANGNLVSGERRWCEGGVVAVHPRLRRLGSAADHDARRVRVPARRHRAAAAAVAPPARPKR